MASYNDTVLTNSGIAILNRVLAGKCTVTFTRAVSSIADYSGKTLSELQALTSLDSIEQNGVATRFDVRSKTMVSIDLLFTNEGLQSSYEIKTIGLYAKASDSSTEVLYAIATASDPETMPAYVDQKLAKFTLTLYTKVGQADKTSITITDEGVVKSINGTIKPDANGNVTLSYYSQAEVDQKVSSLSSRIDSLNSTKTNNTDFEAVKNRVSAVEFGKADKTSVYDKGTADGRYLQRDASTTLKSGSVLRWDDSGHANDGNNVPYTAGGLKWTGKTDSAEIRAEETGADNLDLVFDLGDDGSNSVDFRWNNVSKAKVNSSGKFTGHVDWANVDGKDTYTQAEVDAKLGAKADTTSVKETADSLNTSITNAQGDIRNLQDKTDNIANTVSKLHTGDRNLARGDASSKDWFDFQGFNNLINYCHDLATYPLETLKDGDVVTFGITMKNDGVTSGTMIFLQRGDVSVWDRDYGWLGSPSPVNVTDVVPNGTEKALVYTTPITAGMLNGNSAYTIHLRTDYVPAGGKLSFRYAFVKKGTLATDWTPAPEELDDSIFQIKQAADKLQSDLTSAKGAISSLDAKMPQAAYVPVTLENRTDLNSMKTCGFFMIRNEAINSPVPGWVYVKVMGVPDRLTQFAWQDLDPAQQWCRLFDGNNWLPWVHYTQAI